jgi:cyclase
VRASVCFVLLLLLPGFVRRLDAQMARNFDVIQIAKDVYVFAQRRPLTYPVDGNTTVIVNDDDVVVVDAKATPSTAREVIAEIRRITSKPVTYVINTHWHGDHHYGNDTFRKTFPAVQLVAHANTRTDLLIQDTDSIRLATIASIPAAMESRRANLATNTLPGGDPLPAEMREFYTAQLEGMRFAARELQDIVITPPSVTISDRLTLHRGNRRIEVRYLGRANTRGDLVVHLPLEKIVITGDILVAPVPFAFGSFLGEWPNVLAAVRRLDANIIVPGHGPPQTDWAYLDRVSALLQSVTSQVSAAVAAGKDLAATRAALKLDSLAALFGGGSILNARSFQAFFVTPAVERAFLEARGELPPPPQ